MSNSAIYINSYIQQLQSISLPNKYTNWYCQLIARAVLRASTRKQAELICNLPIEAHHILPKSFGLGGETDELNCAYLTTREHFVCHWLLTKMVQAKNKAKMILALSCMNLTNKHQNRYATKVTSRVYTRIKQEANKHKSAMLKGRANPRKGIPNGKKGIPNGRKGISTGQPHARKGVPSGRKGVPNPKISEALIGKPSKRKGVPNPKISEALNSRPKIICPHCNKIGTCVGNMRRYHFDNCKSLFP